MLLLLRAEEGDTPPELIPLPFTPCDVEEVDVWVSNRCGNKYLIQRPGTYGNKLSEAWWKYNIQPVTEHKMVPIKRRKTKKNNQLSCLFQSIEKTQLLTQQRQERRHTTIRVVLIVCFL